jgi:glycine oxidase
MSEVVVVGGGVIGCTVAFELAARHRVRVTVLERSVPGAEASSAAAGILGAQIESHRPDPEVFALMLASRERHAWLDQELRERAGFGSGFRRCGVLRATFGGDLGAEYGWQRDHNARFVDGDSARAIEPALSPSIRSAVHLPDEAQVDPPMLLRALQQACASLGVKFRTGLTVTGVSRRGVDTQEGRIEADAIVVAAGSWSSMLSGLPTELRRVRPVRGQIVQVDTRPPIVRNIVFGDRGYVVARPDGRTILGSTMEEAGHVKEVTVAGVNAVLTQSLALLPGLANAPITATWCGFRPATHEDRPLIGRVDDGVFVATGHHRNGILLAPETARLVADLIATGTCDRDLTPFSPRAAG